MRKYRILLVLLLLAVCLQTGLFFLRRGARAERPAAAQPDGENDAKQLAQVPWSELSCEDKEAFLERLVMTNFSPLIQEAVNRYYGEIRGFSCEEITDVKKGVRYEIRIKISTFKGAHNPPLGRDEVTLQFKRLGDGKVVNFKHEKIEAAPGAPPVTENDIVRPSGAPREEPPPDAQPGEPPVDDAQNAPPGGAESAAN